MAPIDWKKLSFKIQQTKSIIISRYSDGKWSEPVVSGDFTLGLDAYAGVFHYANTCFEGLKAFKGADGSVRVFRPEENAARMQRSGSYLDMPTPSEKMFMRMVMMCVRENIDYIPPFGYNGSLYIRPLLVGCNPQLNVESSTETLFAVMCNPVGLYSGKTGVSAVTAALSRNYDRVAPNGSGCYKLGANYAPSFHAYNIVHGQGYKELLYLDPATHSKIDEFGTSNFFAIKGNTYVTPLSNSVLPSITNKSLQELAADMGLKVEKRPVPAEELAEFDEVNACGTAVVITPISSLDDKPTLEGKEVTKTYTYCEPGDCGKISRKMYDLYRAIQDGREEDPHEWCMIL